MAGDKKQFKLGYEVMLHICENGRRILQNHRGSSPQRGRDQRCRAVTRVMVSAVLESHLWCSSYFITMSLKFADNHQFAVVILAMGELLFPRHQCLLIL